MDGGECKILAGCNEAGALYIKPWVIHNEIEYPIQNSIIKFEGKGSVCPAEDGVAGKLNLDPKQYIKEADDE
jgi:hypothetical protein